MSSGAKRIAILGATGSIGRQALDIVAADEAAARRAGQEPRFAVCALAAGRNWQLLAEQARRFRPEFVALAETEGAEALRAALPDRTTLLAGPQAMVELVHQCKPSLVLTAMVGTSGLAPTLAAIDVKADLAVANKESLVMAGAMVMFAARAAGVNVLPVDSEHSAVFQCLAGHRREDVRRVILTASGGPFRTWAIERIRRAALSEVLNHPTWRMGRKITIDSATLVNKALEVIEAHWLFDLPGEAIEVVIHPESMVHACVEFCDGSVLAQMGPPSMCTPIAYALYYPRRAPRLSASSLDLAKLGKVHFASPDPARYPALALGYEVIRRGGTSGATLNAANETAVAAYVEGRLDFGQIVEIAQTVLNQADCDTEVNIRTVLAADTRARELAAEVIGGAS